MEVKRFVKACQHSNGGVSASEGHDPHMLYTLSAVQVLAIMDALDESILDLDRLVEYVSSLQQADGSFWGDKWGEVDIRFSFCAIATLSILKRLDRIDLNAAIEFVLSCQNAIDGGFGSRPGSESHSGLVYCGLGALSLANQLDRVNAEQLGWWLSERQLISGGLNGRPEKLPDLCYSWWVLSSLRILGRLHWIDRNELIRFMLACQDVETGGFCDRPGNQVDPFHTLFGLAGLSLLLHDRKEDDHERQEAFELLEPFRSRIKPINPVLCMPQEIIDRLQIKMQLLCL